MTTMKAKAFELKSGWTVSLPTLTDSGVTGHYSMHIRRVGHDFQNRLIELTSWDGQQEILDPMVEVEVTEAP
jgi:hypothetical protein